MKKQVEYEALREEIMSTIQNIKNYRSLLYTIVVAALAFAFDRDEAILFLIPAFIIMPIYLLEMQQVDSQMKLGAYIYVFLEPKTECKWETRTYKYDNLHKNKYRRKIMPAEPYWYLSFGCLFLSLLKLNFNTINLNFWLVISLQILLLLLIVYIFIKKRINHMALKEKYINEWMEIKRLEKKSK